MSTSPKSRRKRSGHGAQSAQRFSAIHPPHSSDAARPLFAEPLHVGRPNLPDRPAFFERIERILDRAWLTNNGQEVQEFESAVARVAGVRHCVATSSGTTALMVLAQALKLTGEVIMPAMTFIATPHAFAMQGVTPVFADIDPVTCCIDPARVARLITPRTSAIVGVHLWGQPCDVPALQSLADAHNVPLLFDAAHAFGCTRDSVCVGGLGLAETFSFHATKFVTTGEGGAIVTNNDELAERMRLIRNFGFVGSDDVGMLGTNAKLSEIAAAMGLVSLSAMDAIVSRNRTVYQEYQRHLDVIPGVTLRSADHAEEHNYQYVIARIDESVAGISRDQLLAALQSQNVLARRYFYPGCHRSAPYGAPDSPCAHLPVTDELATQVLSLPGGSAVDPEQAAAVCGLIERCITHSHSIRCA